MTKATTRPKQTQDQSKKHKLSLNKYDFITALISIIKWLVQLRLQKTHHTSMFIIQRR